MKRLFSFALAFILTFGIITITFQERASASIGIRPDTYAANPHTLVIRTDGSLWGLGQNDRGQLGDGTNINKTSWIKIMDDVTSIVTARDANIAIKSDESLWVWGSNSHYLSADGTRGTREDILRPIKIMDSVATAHIGHNGYFAIKSDGSLWAWGDYFGYGDVPWHGLRNSTDWNNPDDRYKPIKIMDEVDSFSEDGGKILVVKKDATLWGIGHTSESSRAFTKIMDNVSEVSINWNLHSNTIFVIKTDGSLWGWGDNRYGILGDATTQDRTDPIKIMDDVAHIAIAGGYGTNFTAVIKKDRSLWAWGAEAPIYNTRRDERYMPHKITDNVAIVVDSYHPCLVIKTDGSLWSWQVSDDWHLTKQIDNGVVFAIGTLILKEDGCLWGYGPRSYPSYPFALEATGMLIDGVRMPSNAFIPIELPSSWAANQVNVAIATNLVPQSLQSRYTQAITRAEFAALAVALFENVRSEITGRTSFTDTNDINVQKAASIGVVTGVGDGRFNPNGALTRQEAAVMLSRLSDALGTVLPTRAATFADNSSIATWAIDHVGRVQAADIMGGTGGNMFSPQGAYTREQSIVTILRVYDTARNASEVGTDRSASNVRIGDIVQFGRYDWRVLDIQDGKALLLSDKILEYRQYHTEYVEITWAGSSIRRYLNGEFLNRFTAAEQELVMETRVVNSDNPWFGTTGGGVTMDKVFLLSIDEVVRYFGDSGQLWNGFSSDDTYWIDDEYNQARLAYLHENLNGRGVPEGVKREAWENSMEAMGVAWWWLRSSGHFSYSAALVADVGWLNLTGTGVLSTSGGVRPVMWLNLQS